MYSFIFSAQKTFIIRWL